MKRFVPARVLLFTSPMKAQTGGTTSVKVAEQPQNNYPLHERLIIESANLKDMEIKSLRETVSTLKQIIELMKRANDRIREEGLSWN